MNKTVSFQKNLLIFGIPLLIIAIMVLISKSTFYFKNPDILSIGITFDLLLTLPIVYFLLIRKTNIPKTTVVPFLILGIIVCSLILPTENQYYLSLFKTWLLPVIELSIVSFVIFNVWKAIKKYKKNKIKSVDFYTTLKKTCQEILPKALITPVVTEISVFYYGFIYWKKRKLEEGEFSYHKESGSISLLIALIFIIGVETITIHFLVAKWNIVLAWVLTFLSIYSSIQIIGFVKSMIKRPISIENNKLFLRYGIMNETTINLSDIDSIEISSKDITTDKETRKLSILGELEGHNIIIKLKKENTLFGLYGIKRTYKNLAFYVDNKNEFKNQVELYLNHKK